MADSFNLFGTDLFGNALRHAPGTNAGPLAQRFTVPPLSVLNAREGDWQARKRAWISVGIESETGRGAGANSVSQSALALSGGWEEHPAAAPGSAFRPNAGLDEKTQKALGCYMANGAVLARGDGSGSVGTSIFDPVLCELAYSWWSPPVGHILDPFAGGSVRGIVAALLGRSYTGIDLRPEQVAANDAQAARITPTNRPRWIVEDSRKLPSLDVQPADFVFSCPPYGDLERYSDDQRDLSAMDHSGFVDAYRDIIAASCALLKPDRFACFVVGDFRDKRGEYRDFVSTTIAAFKAAGLALYNEAILVTAVGSLPIRVGKQFAASRKLGKTHQNVLVFVKGDGKRAAAACSTTNPFGDES